jgi:Ni/Co efflux regulator RcnB
MKRLIANLLALGVLGGTTLAAAQDQRQRDDQGNRKHEIQQNRRDRAGAAADRGAANRDLRIDRRQNAVGNQRWAQFQRNARAQRRYRAGFWRPPAGYYYRRWSYGQILPSLYLSQNYWINNWLAYGLFAPPSGLVWVRYGPDVLLVDRYTGQIVQVRYGIFY